jgi:hypothetical protein
MMALFTISAGGLLIALGAWGYLGAEEGHRSVTALIPAFFGLALILLGLLAFKEHLRKHVMHLAAMIGLIGLVVPLARSAGSVPELIREGRVIKEFDGQKKDMTRAVVSQLVMAGVCLVFVGLCVNSFVQARRARARREQAGPA